MKVGLNKGSQELPFRNFRNSFSKVEVTMKTPLPLSCECVYTVDLDYVKPFMGVLLGIQFCPICESYAPMVGIQDLAWRCLESCDIDDPIQEKT